ncbi:MAG: DUF3109 family protein [Chitinophagales bacterium]|nr:DUF3109 family protein [Chitinophagales bacterium]MDW8419176.1 DUF3109 family protein [Chitinophagales bacterium]
MIVIDDKIVSDDVVEKHFVCNLQACKGECCVAGDFGAPLEESELSILNEIYEKVKPYLTAEGIKTIEREGKYVFVKENKEWCTPLMPGGGCAWLNYDSNGTVICAIEKAYNEGAIGWKKPLSCHLYPIRITQYKTYDAVNYERWSICSAACKNGKALKVPLYQFLKEALIRKYGEEFWEALHAYATQMQHR